jgi:hypothetical protein
MTHVQIGKVIGHDGWFVNVRPNALRQAPPALTERTTDSRLLNSIPPRLKMLKNRWRLQAWIWSQFESVIL